MAASVPRFPQASAPVPQGQPVEGMSRDELWRVMAEAKALTDSDPAGMEALLERFPALAGALVARVPVELRWTRSGRFSAAARAEVSSVTLRGEGTGGLALFELTDGRGPGTSALWGLDAQIGLTERLRGSVVYDGRAPSAGRVVQTVRVQVSAAL